MMNPNTPGVVERIENKEERLFSSDLYTRLYGMGIIFLNDEIDMDNANSIIAQLLYLDASDSDRPIYMYIHSGGGDVYSGFAIYDTIMRLQKNISTVCYGQASSMAAVLLAAGTPGMRRILPHARVMIHETSAFMGGQFGNVSSRMKELERVQGDVYKIMSENTGQSIETLKEDMKNDKFFNAQEAIDYGIVDSIYESTRGKEVEEEDGKNEIVQE